MASLIFDGIILLPKQQIDLNDIQNYLFKKSEIPMKVIIKPFKDYYPQFGISNVNLQEYKERYKNKIYINKKVIHHLHYKSKDNIAGYICGNCNLKIKNKNELVILFHNSKGYDNNYLINTFSEIENVRINCIGENNDRFKMIQFRIPDKKYSIKVIDSLSFLSSKLDDLGKDLEDDKKIQLKSHFKSKFRLVNKKSSNFPSVKKDNLDQVNLPDKSQFYNILTMEKINTIQYNKVKQFYKFMKFKNLKEYLECYLTVDILLLNNVFHNFRQMIYDKFQIDCVRYISAPSLTKDCCFKYTNSKIVTIQDISIYNFIKNSIKGGLSDSISPRVSLDNENQTIGYIDINSMYPHSLRKKFQLEIINLLILNNLMKQNMTMIVITTVLCCVKYVQQIL